MNKQKIDVVIDNDNNFIEMTLEGSSSTLHIEGTKPEPDFLGKAIGNYLLTVVENKVSQEIEE